MDQMLVFGLLAPFLGTALGSAAALGLPAGSARWNAVLAGGAGGAMLAACIWGLILPGMADARIPVLAGVLLGLLVLLIPEHLPRGRMSPGALVLLAVVLHNIPEGMAVGAAYAGGDSGGLTLGIALQNIPDGAVAAVAVLALGQNRWKAFGAGVISGAVEPLAAMAVTAWMPQTQGWLPLAMGFAAGAMLYVIFRELAPGMGRSGWGTVAFAAAFLLMAG